MVGAVVARRASRAAAFTTAQLQPPCTSVLEEREKVVSDPAKIEEDAELPRKEAFFAEKCGFDDIHTLLERDSLDSPLLFLPYFPGLRGR